MEKLMRGEHLEPDPADPEAVAAATKIQATYRGHKTREEVKEQKAKETEAAIKIQASFRGHKAREEVKEIQSKTSITGSKTAVAATESVAAPAQNEAPAPETVEDEQAEDYGDPKYTEAIVKIQAGYRGMKAREEVKTRKESISKQGQKAETVEKEGQSEPPVAELPADVDEAKPAEESKLDDSSQTEIEASAVDDGDTATQEAAATKIQAGFRGLKARKEVKEMKASVSSGEVSTDKSASEDNQTTEEAAMEVKKSGTTEPAVSNDDDEELSKVATKIQATFRGHQTRKEMKKSSEENIAETVPEGSGEKSRGNEGDTAGEVSGETG